MANILREKQRKIELGCSSPRNIPVESKQSIISTAIYRWGDPQALCKNCRAFFSTSPLSVMKGYWFIGGQSWFLYY